MILGDSKSTTSKTWTTALPIALAGKTGGVVGSQNAAVAGESVATAYAGMAAKLAAMPDDGVGVNYTTALLNWGVNDAPTDETTWKTDYLDILDKVHAKAPNAKVYLMRPWMVGWDARAAVVHGWIDDLVAARPTFAHVGPDESVWLKGSDNGAANTVDGVHYSAIGNTLCAAQWQTVLGY